MKNKLIIEARGHLNPILARKKIDYNFSKIRRGEGEFYENIVDETADILYNFFVPNEIIQQFAKIAIELTIACEMFLKDQNYNPGNSETMYKKISFLKDELNKIYDKCVVYIK